MDQYRPLFAGRLPIFPAPSSRLSHAHAAVLLMTDFVKFLSSSELHDGPERSALSDLALLFGLMIIERDAGDFVGILSEEQIENVRDSVLKTLTRLRPNAIGLVDAFDFSDARLKSALGKYDGEVYTALMSSTKGDVNCMNKFDVIKPVVSLGGIGLASSL